jgi:hypothetical protein
MLKILTVILIITLIAWIMPHSAKSTTAASNTAIAIDGPYVLYRGDSIIVHYIDSVNGLLSLRTMQWDLSQRDQVQLLVNTDEEGRTFNVKLHPNLSTEKSDWGKPKKMLVLSDIEGNFSAMRQLLQGNGVMDQHYRWTFGDGHLALVGDFVDRGAMVTEVLWLIYSFESQAEASGGKVHFILGNHEIMNMSGELKYVHPRYRAHAGTMNLPYLQLFGPQAELGRWFATKNIAERIGNILLTHGGFSSYINQIEMPLIAVNDTARLYYTDTSSVYPGPYAQLLFSDDGPLWYRGYYHGAPRATHSQVNSTLHLYNSRIIVTGHTIIAKEIVSVFGGKIINTDVPHYRGFSEALLFEGGKMYRVNASGEQKKIAGLH